jgi:isopenicillin N synthase-like dioxygenase
MSLIVAGGPSASLLRFVHYDRAVQQRAPFSDAEPSEGDTNSEEVFEDHKDFGLLTLVPISRVPGLHIWQAGPLGHDAQWIPVEEVYAPQRADATRNGFHLLVFCGETMDHATASYFPAVRHKVVLRPSQGPCGSLGRISSPFFLRALPDATVPRLHDRTATYSVSEFEADYDQTH